MSRDHSYKCTVCGEYRGGMNDAICDCFDGDVNPKRGVLTHDDQELLARLSFENKVLRRMCQQVMDACAKQPPGMLAGTFCEWCHEAWMKPTDASEYEVENLARMHLDMCQEHPLRREVLALREETLRLTQALLEAKAYEAHLENEIKKLKEKARE